MGYTVNGLIYGERYWPAGTMKFFSSGAIGRVFSVDFTP